MMSHTENEQKLVDICFSLALTISNQEFINMDNAAKADWVANQLRLCGFDTVPCGSSWGILK